MQSLSVEQRLFFERAVVQYQADLAEDLTTQQYLAGRGFTQQVALQARFGVVRRPMVGHERYIGRLALPYLTPTGVVNIRFRCLQAHTCSEADCPKYLSMDGVESNLYNVMDLKKDSPFICVAEGELDALTLSMAGLPAVGVPGVKSWQKHWSRCLEDFETIYTFGDGDKAGGSFGKFMARETRARPIRMPAGEDCNSLYIERGADGLRRLIA